MLTRTPGRVALFELRMSVRVNRAVQLEPNICFRASCNSSKGEWFRRHYTFVEWFFHERLGISGSDSKRYASVATEVAVRPLPRSISKIAQSRSQITSHLAPRGSPLIGANGLFSLPQDRRGQFAVISGFRFSTVGEKGEEALARKGSTAKKAWFDIQTAAKRVREPQLKSIINSQAVSFTSRLARDFVRGPKRLMA